MATPRTTPVYDLTRVPLVLPPYGTFNTELAEAVYKTIEEHSALWDQDTWRTVIELQDMTTDQEFEVRALSATTPACGTAMCFAGWVGEVAGAAWVLDGPAIATWGPDLSGAEMVVVPRAVLAPVHNPTWDALALALRTHLVERGFDPATHDAVAVGYWALGALGLVHGDWRGLFEADNDLAEIRAVLDAYSAPGGVLKPGYEAGPFIVIDEITVDFTRPVCENTLAFAERDGL